jgi:protein-tyrosine-phosphatase
MLFDRSIRPRVRARIAVASAGFIGPGRQSPQLALSTAAKRGIDMAAHRSALITQASIDATDLVVVMDPAQEHALRTRFRIGKSRILVLGDLDPEPIGRRTIRDPWGCDDGVYEASYARIERCTRELVMLLTSEK